MKQGFENSILTDAPRARPSLAGLLHLLGERPERRGGGEVHVGDAVHVEQDGGRALRAARRRRSRLLLHGRRGRRCLAEPRPANDGRIECNFNAI